MSARRQTLKTPDVTPAQIVTVVGAGIAMAVAFGAPVSKDQSDAIMDFVTVTGPVLLGADAIIRAARAKYLGKRIQ
jgi:hypothetical protein